MPDFVLGGADGVSYGRFVLDSLSRAALLSRVHRLSAPTHRAVAWQTLYEEMLDGVLAPAALLDAALVANQALYSLGSDPLLEVVDVPLMSITTNPGSTPLPNVVPMVNLPTNSFNPNIEPDTPVWFAYVPEAQVAVNPTPDQAYPVSMTLVCQPRDGVEQIPDILLTKWRLAFEDGALAYLYGLTGEPWADAKQQLYYEGRFRAAINNGKANVSMQFQSGSQRATPRRFVTR
jgi:hypothetical protein